MQRSTERAIKAYVAYKVSPLILALIFLAVTFLTIVVPVVVIGCYQRYVVKGVPFPH
jgi:ABC-type glycerol-3-phosphate transport system permease component